MLVTFTPEKATSEWEFLSTIQSTASVTVDTVTFEVAASGATMADKLVDIISVD